MDINDNEFDLFQFVKIIECALTSENPQVKKSLSNLLLMCAIIQPDQQDGPITNFLISLEERVRKLEIELSYLKNQRIDNTDVSDVYKSLRPYWKSEPWSLSNYIPHTTKANSQSTYNDIELNKSLETLVLKSLDKGST